ncbi:MAG: ribonuclease HII [Alphaproteobacteria bacterium]|nr:ribonuclease HII [Alphaproteobacteria bacterium]
MTDDAPTFAFEARTSGPVAGVDEVGRGPMAGPVVAAAVILTPGRIPDGIDDSKALERDTRERLHDEIRAAAAVGIAAASVRTIDAINILQATMLAMRRAVARLPLAPALVIVDGNRLPDLPYPAMALIRGDARSLSVAAASIVAKVVRDRLMTKLAARYPQFGWDNNAGYCTAEHLAAVARHGPSAHHRRSFAPVRAALTQELESQLALTL